MADILVIVAIVVVANTALWATSLRYASRIETVTGPADDKFDVLVHRDGVMLYGRAAAAFNATSTIPTVVALWHRLRRGPWRWAVTVRPSPYPGYEDLVRETFDDEAAAREFASDVADRIRSGQVLWPPDWIW